MARGLAYKAYETVEELTALRAQAEARKQSFIYQRPPADVAARHAAEGRPSIVRFTMPRKEYRFKDVVLQKEVVLAADQVQDFVIRKEDGMPTYHFAVVVDDAEMGVTHVLRGQEHLLNTVNHIALQEALGYTRPTYGHLSVILNDIDGTKMGKRDRDKKIRHRSLELIRGKKLSAALIAQGSAIEPTRVEAWLADDQKQLDIAEQAAVMAVIGMKPTDLPEILVHDFRKAGYLPEALLNFLALLGWNPGGDRERMTVAELVELFSIEGVGKGNAKFGRDKLAAFNTEACAAASESRLVAAMRDYLSVNPDSPLNVATDAQLARLLQMKKGFRLLREVDEATRFFFMSDDQIAYDPDAVEKVLKKSDGQGLGALRSIKSLFDAASDWTAAGLEAGVKALCEQRGLGLGKVAQPIRVAICGTTISPPIFDSLEFLGRERTIARLDRCLRTFS